jgi:hypothetical protein
MGECYVLAVGTWLEFSAERPMIVTISREIVAKRHAQRVMSGFLSASQLETGSRTHCTGAG